MNEEQSLTTRFEANRAHLHAVAYRMLGSQNEADDAVQEAWIRVTRSGANGVENLGGWFTTIVARVCLDMLRARKSRREESGGVEVSAATKHPDNTPNAEQEIVLADTVSLALLVVMETLAPAERLAFVLHDMFDLSFDEIAQIVGCSSPAARQLASRARRRVQGADASSDADLTHQRAVVDAFLRASRSGDLTALVAVLHPDVVLRADQAVVQATAARQAQGAPKIAAEMRGPDAVAGAFLGRARGAVLVRVDGAIGAAWAPRGKPQAVFRFTIEEGKIVALDVVADPESVSALDVTILDN